jgi:hypothetical protein
VTVENIIGWRLDLLRNGAQWQGSQVESAKAEFMELIARTESSEIALSVDLYLDRHTSQKYYANWLAGSGLVLSELIRCSVIDLEGVEIDSKTHLDHWYKRCAQLISVQTRHLKAAQREIPMSLAKYQHSSYDSILPIYA